MKKLLAIGLVFTSHWCSSQTIESLRTDKDVVRFVRWLYRKEDDSGIHMKDKPLGKYIGDNYKDIYKTRGIRFWDKGDFDNNGKADLLFNGYYYGPRSIVVLQFPNDSFHIATLSRYSPYDCWLPTIIRQNSTCLIALYQSFEEFGKTGWQRVTRTDTLAYRFGGFIEKIERPEEHIIQQIAFHTSGCYGPCAIFNLVINSQGKVLYSVRTDETKEQYFESRLDQVSYAELADLLNAIDFTRLRDEYSIRQTDSQTSYLTVTYDDGRKKRIKDYGERGTYGLSRLYNILFSLRYSLNWEKPADLRSSQTQ